MSPKSPAVWPYPGARWWKFDLHTHTPASRETVAWQRAIGTPDEVTPKKWLMRYMQAEIDCVAVTDHNTGEWIDRLKEAYATLEADEPEGFRPLFVFPGVEISVNGGFHLLAVFDRDRSTSDVDGLLGKVEYLGTKGHCDGATRKSSVEVLEAVLEAGGLAIPAHVDQPKGLLHSREDGSGRAGLDANTLRQVFGCSGILAMELVDRGFRKPEVYESAKPGWSEVLGSDCHSFRQDPRPGSRFTWLKMAQPSLEGLRLALMDGERFSIRRSDDLDPFDPFDLPEHFVEGIEIQEARYMGRGEAAGLSFSPWLNALVGGRGTGKSTVVHFLRLAYRRDRELDTLGEESEPRRAFERFDRVPKSREDRGGLLEKTEVLVTVTRDRLRHRLRWRQDGAGAVVEEMTDDRWQPSASQQVTPERFPVRMFSQGQIAALAGESQEALLAVIDEAAKAYRLRDAVEEARRRFLAQRAQLRELDGKLRGLGELTVELEDVNRKLQRFEEARHADVLRAYQSRLRQEREVARQIDSALATAERVEQVAAEVVPENLPERLFDNEREGEREIQAVVGRLHEALRVVREALLAAAATLKTSAQKERDGLPGTPWHSALVTAKQKYAELVESLRSQGVTDPSEYGKLVQERQRLEAETARLRSLEEQRAQIAREADGQRQRLLEQRRALSGSREEFLRRSLSENDYVRIRLVRYGRDPRVIEGSLREVLGAPDDRFSDDILRLEDDEPMAGLVAELLRPEETISPANKEEAIPSENRAEVVPLEKREEALDALKRRVEEACLETGSFGGHFNNYLKRECERTPELLDRLLVWFPEDALEVEYSPKGDGRNFRPIGQASAGQRSAAMLAFLLAHGVEPLVLDQPEDDLDNHLIYDLVVRQMRANKQRRQIIVVTHNPNIVVNGDAEMLHALDYSGGQCRVVDKGSLQESAMRDEVCRVMEGGREAFERRYRRLGREV